MASFSPPRSLGFVKINGDIVSRKVETWIGRGLFCTSGKRVFIGEFDSNRAASFPDCLQSGPLLVKNGVVKYNSDSDVDKGERRLLASEQEHSFVCVLKSGDTAIGISSRMKLDRFADALASDVGCQVALRLTGASTAGLSVRGKIYGNDELPLSTVISVFK